MKVSIHPIADDELTDGAAYYGKEGTPKLGELFLTEFERSVQLLREYPSLGMLWNGQLRRLTMR